tara:strand:- start:18616 stop:19674 length:1059 start_codon:yes stop_codon:yes gene_type:complete
MCRHSCPVSNADGRETHTPQSKMDTLNELRSGKLAWTPENTAPLYACTGCRACTGYCEHDNEPALVLMAGRSQANAEGAGHPALEKYPERFRSRDARLATKLKEHVPSEQRGDSGLVGFWPGCDAVDKGMQDLEAALEIFGALGGEPVVVVDSEQVCGGYPLLAAGYPDMFRWHAERVANSMAKFKTIITNCSACLFTVQRQYAAEGIDLDVDIISVPEYLTTKLQELPKRTNKKPVYYHDPCHLARYSGVIEEPRLVLSRIAELRDFDWSHSDAECCGGAGLLPKTDPDTADSMARRRMREVAHRGGGTIVTACATCTYMLRSNAPSGVIVRDLATFVAEAMDEQSKAKTD